jgi:hypothetical protein
MGYIKTVDRFMTIAIMAFRVNDEEGNKNKLVRFEVFTTVTMKNVIFWDVVLCRFRVKRSFEGGMFLTRGFFTLKMEAILFSETSLNARSTQHHIPEDDILNNKFIFLQFKK